LALALCVVMAGCSSTDYSMNMRAATVQASATVASKAILEGVSVAKYDATKSEMILVMGEVSKFLETGKIGDLPFDQAKTAIVKYMTEKGWTQYVPAVEGILDIIAAQTVPVEKLGSDNIAIIQMGLKAAVTSAETSKKEWRVPDSRGLGTVQPNAVEIKLYRR